MRVQRLAGECDFDDCATVYLSDRGTMIFQGGLIRSVPDVRFSPGEGAVELPVNVVREALRELDA